MANGDILSIGASGLRAFQRSLAAIGHNVASVNTEGYSRQRVEIQENYPTPQTNGFIGTGVRVVTTKRMFDEIVHRQLQYRTSTFNNYDVYLEFAQQVDNVLADPAAGLSPAIQGFFDSVHKVADDPTSMPARNVLLSDAGALVDRFHSLDQLFSDLRNAVNVRLEGLTNQVNTLTAEIATTNQDIVTAMGLAANQPPNDLLDKRDQMILDLSKLIGIKTLKQDDGSINIFIGSGQAVVLGARSTPLSAQPNLNDQMYREIHYTPTPNSPSMNISPFVYDGEIGGLLTFREQILKPAINEVGRVAIALTESFNDQHAQGMDLNNMLGGNFFTPFVPNTVVPIVAQDVNNAGLTNITAVLSPTAASDLTAHDYRIVFDGTNYQLIDDVTKVSTTILPAPGALLTTYPNLNSIGLDVTIDPTGGPPVQGDTWYLRPTRMGGKVISVAITDPRNIAAADPVRTLKGVANLGTCEISQATAIDITQPLFNPPPVPPGFNNIAANPDAQGNMRIRFLSILPTPPTYEVVDPATGLPITGGAGPFNYTAGVPINLPPGAAVPAMTVTITGSPQPGDTFDIVYNTNGFSDNRNAKALANLQRSQLMIGGTATYQEAFSQLVVKVGNNTRTSQINSDAQNALMTQAQDHMQAISGVNLDEEAANMVKFQQAYSAAAQIIATSNSIFQTLLSVVAR